MKRYLLLGTFLLSSYVYADMNGLSTTTDSLGELTKALGSGGYSHPDAMDIPASSEVKVSIAAKEEPVVLNNSSISTKKYNVIDSTEWILNCTKDRFDNTRMCYIAKGNITVGINNGSYIVMIYGDHYPRSTSALKIDNNATVYGIEGVSYSTASVIQQMKKGKILYTRYRVWPKNYNVDRQVDLVGFTTAFNEMLVAYKQL